MSKDAIKCTVLYRPRPDIRETARQIIDDVITVHAAVGSINITRTEVDDCLRNIQRQARLLLTPGAVTGHGPVDMLADFVTRLERGETISPRELKLTLVSVDMAAAKIRRHIYGQADGAKKEVGNAAV
jgi:hypothetical protein